ncbi:Hypothetical protein IALB_0970 [Ignavibacterium album JCM 16511]|uniref:DUF4384 domain-containing protein n=1 Tax=Ignavibacterium album (strain DSM 19864 / JCM 16511 / NBRC 101810 / Mat9-16) TaxID=945713 RepID=I0AI75_IGNAJ|nr:hypothetical protein [Ignavibacterium album]AFH48682.1 Hypothetical protein IALB_0970 [Ignavibacterium album JCM 16511]
MATFFSYLLLLYLCLYQITNERYASFYKENLIVQIDLVIYSDKNTFRIARNFDRINKNEKFQVIVKSKSDVRLVILNKSRIDCNFLSNIFINSNRTYYLPSPKEYFSFDGLNKSEEIYIVIFQRNYKHSDLLLKPSSDCTYKWEFINSQFNDLLSIKSKPVPPILQLSGNIRTSELSEEIEGENVIIKKYSFDVE